MSIWKRYPSMERIAGLRNEGRELLGKYVIVEVKRDGSNVSVWLGNDNTIHISSHNLEEAEENIQTSLKVLPEYDKVKNLLEDEFRSYAHTYIVYGELVNPGYGATRIEPKHKKGSYIIFDIYDTSNQTFLTYTQTYMLCYHWKLPIVEAIEAFVPLSLDELIKKKDELLKWCKRHRREGVVLKVYQGEQIQSKEKVDIPKLPKVSHDQPLITYPPMPTETIERAILHAVLDVKEKHGMEKWRDKGIAIPTLVQRLNEEGREHNYNVPRNIFQIYLDVVPNKVLLTQI